MVDLNNAIANAQTAIYQGESLYAKIAHIPLGQWGDVVYSTTLAAVLRLYSLKSDGTHVVKEYTVGFNGGSVKITDQSGGGQGPGLVATVTNGVAELYASGYQAAAPVQVQLVYCNRPSMIEFVSRSGFETDLSTATVYRPGVGVGTYQYQPLTLAYLNGWSDFDGSAKTYSMNGRVYIDLAMKGGPVGSSAPFTLPVFTPAGLVVPVMFLDTAASTWKLAKLQIYGTTGNVNISGVTDTSQVRGSFSYRIPTT